MAVREINLIVPGAPRTKKTHSRIFRAGRGNSGRIRVMPSKVWTEWCERSVHELAEQKRKMRESFPLLADFNCTALFYRDARRGDAVGFYQGLADLLERSGIVADDVQIVSWDGSRLLKDAENPRVELTLTPVDT